MGDKHVTLKNVRPELPIATEGAMYEGGDAADDDGQQEVSKQTLLERIQAFVAKEQSAEDAAEEDNGDSEDDQLAPDDSAPAQSGYDFQESLADATPASAAYEDDENDAPAESAPADEGAYEEEGGDETFRDILRDIDSAPQTGGAAYSPPAAEAGAGRSEDDLMTVGEMFFTSAGERNVAEIIEQLAYDARFIRQHLSTISRSLQSIADSASRMA